MNKIFAVVVAVVGILAVVVGGFVMGGGSRADAQMAGATLQILPTNSSITTGNVQFFMAIYDPDGSGPQVNQNVTNVASWTSSNTSIASPQGTAAFMGQNAGTVTISASYLNATVQTTLSVNGAGGNNGGVIQTQNATNISQNGVTLNALVNPNNVPTSVWFEYGTTPSLGQTTGSQTIGSGNFEQNVSILLSNLLPNTLYYFRAVSQNQFGTNFGGVLSFTTGNTGGGFGNQPQVFTQSATNVTFTSATLQGTVNPNINNVGTNTTIWFEYGTTPSLGQSTMSQTVSGSVNQTVSGFLSNLQPNTTYYFRITAQNQFGTSWGSVLSFTTNNNGGGNGGGTSNQSPIVFTRTVAGVGQTIATFRGAVNPVNTVTNVWFEYGTTRALGLTTGYQTVANGNFLQTFNASPSSLQPDTTYFYRAAGQNAWGTNFGAITSFHTSGVGGIVPPSPVPPPPAPVPPSPVPPAPTPTPPPPSGSGTASVSLMPTIDRSEAIDPSVSTTHPKPGETVSYTIAYRNTGTGNISNLILTLVLPQEVEYVSSNPPSSGMSTNGLVIMVPNLGPNAEGVATVKLRVKSDAQPGAMITFASILNYVDPQKRPQSVSGSVSVAVGDPTEENSQGLASIADNLNGGSGFWILILILALVVTQFIYHIMRDRDSVATVKTTTTRYTPPGSDHYGTYTTTTKSP